MVARDRRYESGPTTRRGALFAAWRKALTGVLRVMWREAPRAGRRLATSPAAGWASGVYGAARRHGGALPRSAGWGGVMLAIAGTAAALVWGTLGGGTLIGAALFAAESAAWALFRLVALATLADDADRRVVVAAWGAGLAPFAVGMTPLARAVAFVASAALTYVLLRRTERVSSRAIVASAALTYVLLRRTERVSSRATAAAVGIAFGGQTLAMAVSWIVRNGLVFTVGSGS